MNAHSPAEEFPPLALLAGGMATRLGALTAQVPKSLMPVAGEPFIAHQLRLVACEGVRDIVICCGHLGEQIEKFVGDGSRFACRVRYSSDGPTLLGTGGAIRRALPLLGPRFWVMYGDSYLPTPFAPVLAAFQISHQPALMTVFANQKRWDTSNVHFANGRIMRYDKRNPQPEMQYVDYGLGLYSAGIFHRWPPQTTFDLCEVQRQLVEQGTMAGYEVADRFYEIGSVSGLEETNSYLAARRSTAPPVQPPPAHVSGVPA